MTADHFRLREPASPARFGAASPATVRRLRQLRQGS